ncbi:hypothetical protein KIW84_058127, partial [Lathyrus oleraceus]
LYKPKPIIDLVTRVQNLSCYYSFFFFNLTKLPAASGGNCNSSSPFLGIVPSSPSLLLLLLCRKNQNKAMSYDDVEIEDMEWNEELQSYTYPCPCGDLFQITKEDLKLGEEIAGCPSCSLYITVIYNMEDFLGDSDQNRTNKGLQPSKQAVTVA